MKLDRALSRSAVMIASMVCLGLMPGCWASNPGQNTPETENTSKADSDTGLGGVSSSGEVVEGWPEPQVAFVLTGEQHGYLEPCGCSETQSGGISRRADLFRQLREDKGWEVVALDLGDTMKRARQQDKIKFGVLHAALGDMGYEAMTLGPSDLKLEVDFLFSTMANSNEPGDAVPFISANVLFYGSPDLGTPARSRIIEHNGVKIGVTGVLGKKYESKIFPSGGSSAADLLTVNDPVESLTPVVAELKEQGCDLLVLLSQAPQDETKEILGKIPDFDVCLTGGGPEDPSGVTKKVGDTLLIEAGRKGKYAAVLGYYPDDAKMPFRFELVDLDKERFKRTQAMEDHMAFYQELLTAQNIIESEPAVPHPSGHSFVGAEQCGECHTKAFAHWKTTRHSHATETLIHGGPDYHEAEWINRIHDPECVTCHATGWNPQEVFRYDSGFVSMENTPHLTGQSCENCHGPGSHHTELEKQFVKDRQNTPEIQAARAEMKLDLATAEKQVCRKCHDFENSPKFDFAKYWAKVVHRGKD